MLSGVPEVKSAESSNRVKNSNKNQSLVVRKSDGDGFAHGLRPTSLLRHGRQGDPAWKRNVMRAVA